MTSHGAIIGVDRCSCRRTVQDIADAQVWAILEAKHPGLLHDVHEYKGPGEKMHVPHAIEGKLDRAKRLDDGEMTLGELAGLAGCCVKTASRARKEKGRE